MILFILEAKLFFPDEAIEVVFRYTADETFGAECRANVICVGSDGKILGISTVTGTEGEKIELEKQSFSGYEYLASSDNYAFYSAGEINILVSYVQKDSHLVLYLAIAAGALALVVAGGFLLSRLSGKKSRKSSIEIEE